MNSATFTLSAFGDEIDQDLALQLKVLNQLEVGYLDLRGAWGKNVMRMEDDDLARVKTLCAQHAIQVACLGSPIGKSPIVEPIDTELNNLRKAIHIGETLGCRRVRVFAFYPPDTSTNAHYNDYVEEAGARLSQLAGLAAGAGFTLYLENEKGVVNDVLTRCQALIEIVNSPALRFLWDSANFVQEREAHVVERGWPMLGKSIGYVHIKDAMLGDGHVVPAGEGDGELPLLLTKLKENGYQGFLSLEPHLKLAGHSTGHSGTDGMTIAVTALRKVMAETGCIEVK